MKRRTKVALISVVLFIGVGSVAFWQWPTVLRTYFSYRVHAATTSLPQCDRVEVFHLDGDRDGDDVTGFPIRPYDSHSGILGQLTLTGVDAEGLAVLWRSQTFGYKYQAMCHEPAYGFRFYRGPSLKFETSVCFHCNNFYVTTIAGSGWWGFDAKTPRAKDLLNRLQEIFPKSAPNQNTTPTKSIESSPTKTQKSF